MSESSPPVLDEKTVISVLVERGWATEDEIEEAHIDLDMGMFRGPLEIRLLDKGVITEKDLHVLQDLCRLPESIAGFTIIKSIGAGAMGVVYLATDPDSGENIALKVINSRHCDDHDFIKRFLRETKAITDLKHENIAGSIGSGEYKDQFYLAMEYIDGPSLADILHDHGPVPEQYALRCIKQIASGLSYAFDKCGIVHRDIKPANILIKRSSGGKEDLNLYIDEDTAKIIDFGLAKSTDGADDLTMTGMTMGTPHYMAPEQIRGDSVINQQVDIYALGATLYHLLTGEPPFDGNTPGAIMLAHINNPIPDPAETIPSLKPETINLVRMCLAKDKGERYTTFKAVINACDAIMEQFDSDAGSGMRVLRKPMKIQSTRSIKKRNHHSPSSSAPTHVSNDAETMEIESDTVLKAGGDSGKQESTAYLAGEAALRKVQTERVRRDSTRRIKKKGGSNDGNDNKVGTRRFTPDQSVAFEENPDTVIGSGKLPWVVLLCAVIALALSLAARFSNS